jgi:Uma2 family endonuclease
MSTAAAGLPVPDHLITAEEYAKLPDRGVPTELVRGRVVEMNVPAPRHGEICWKVARLVGVYAEDRGLGRIVINDAGVITRRDPDSVRGGDIAYYSYTRLPPGPLPPGYLPVLPELVFEVRSPTDRWTHVFAKVAEYLEAGVTVVCILDQMSERVLVYRAEEMPITLHGEDALHLPDILGEFRVAVRRFFE